MKEYPHDNRYLVTEDGKIFSKRVNRFLSPCERDDGYLIVGMKDKTFRLHRIVAETYIPNTENLPEVNHKNGIKSDCHKDNLEWVTSKQNKEHVWGLGLYKDILEDHCNTLYTNDQIHEVCKMMEDGYQNKEIVDTLQVNKDTVAHIRCGDIWKEISKEYNITTKRQDRKSLGTILKVCNLLEQGCTNSEISSKLGDIKSKEVHRIRKGEIFPDIVNKFNIPKSKFSRITEWQVVKVCELISEGKSNKNIAEVVGTSVSIVSKIKRRKCWNHITSKYNW